MSEKVSIKGIVHAVYRVLKTSWKDHPYINAATIVIAVITSLLGFAQEAVLAMVINALSGNPVEWLSQRMLLVLFIASFIIPSLISGLQTYIDTRSWRDIYNSWILRQLKKRISIDIARYDDPEFQDIMNRVDEKGSYSIVNVNLAVPTLFQHSVTLITSLVVLWIAEPLIALVVICSYVPYLAVRMKYSDEVFGIWDKEGLSRRRFWDMRRLIEKRSTIGETILFQNGNEIWNRVKNLLNDFTEKQNKVDARIVFFDAATILLASVLVGLCIIWLAQRAFAGFVAAGTFAFFISSIFRLQSALKMFFITISRQYENVLFSIDYFKFLDIEPFIQINPNALRLDTSMTPRIEFKNVSFSYPGSTKKVFNDFNLVIEPGQKIAIVGVNGAGKTTLMKLLSRIYDPTEGSILINGTNLKDIDLEDWRSMLGILFQDFNKYNFEAKEAIWMGDINAEPTDSKIMNAAIESGADEFIQEWVDKYEQQIGREFGGIDPSKGQNQKLAISRTFFRNPRVMVLDEPTASIDAEAEQKIFDRLEKGPRERTTILISHRFSTVRNVDKIIVIENGEIAEQGSHEELMKTKGIYERLFVMQAKGYM